MKVTDMTSRSLLFLPLIALVACADKVADSGLDPDSGTEADADTDADSDTDSDADADADTDSDADTDVEGFSLQGMVLDAATLSPAASGLCLHAIDPTNALAGAGDIDLLGSTQTGDGGAFQIDGIVYEDSRLMMLAADCADEGSVMPTATGVDPTAYAEIEDGGVVADRVAVSISAEMAGGVDGSLSAVGWTGGSVSDVGMVFGFIQDASRTPIEGATLDCGSCTAVFYMDTDPTDGLFSTAGALNTSTSAAAGGVFVVPDAPLTSYSADDGSSTFPAHFFGGMAGTTTVLSIIAE